MKETKRRWMSFTFYDRSGIERDLEEQAAKGWMLEKCSAAGWIYRKIEPAKIHFAVVYFPAASAFDPGPSDQEKRFREFCEHTGWELIASNIQMQIFCNRNENPIPIETDPAIELEHIHVSVKKTMLPTYVMDVVLACMQLGLAFWRFSHDPIGEAANSAALLSVLFWAFLIFFCGAQIFLYYRWYWNAKKAAKDGFFLETRSTDRFQICVGIFTTLAVVFLLWSFGGPNMIGVALLMVAGILGITALMVMLTNHLKKKQVSAKWNRVLTYGIAVVGSLLICGIVLWLMVGVRLNHRDRTDEAEAYEYNGWTFYVYQDPIPLRIEDLMEVTYEGYSYERISEVSSPLLSRYEARQRPRHDALAEVAMQYRIIEVKAGFLYPWALEQMREDFDHNYGYPEDDTNWEEHRVIDPNPWGAKEGYQLVLGGEEQYRYLLCYENHIIEIDLEWEPSEEQMKTIQEKLTRESERD